ncbi:MAG: ribosomal protein S18-alanine N-acetyltransferase [Microbacterium sp.]
MSMRRATTDDLVAIMAIERASFPTDAWSEAMMSAELASPHSVYTVVEEGGRVIGYGGVRAVAGAGEADIQTIALDAAARGRGRGRDLLTDLLGHALAAGAVAVFLEVRADNPVAQALYRSEGFAELGRRARYYQPDDVDAVVMRLDVRGWAAARGLAGAQDAAGRGWC